MTQNEKDLLLKDLCARLPYGVMGKFGDSKPSKITNITHDIDSDSWFVKSEGESDGMMCEINNVKPYLFPLSSMTEEQKKELSEIIDLEVEVAISHIKNGTPNLTTGITRLNWLLKNHFDIYGLIPMGLTIDATGLNIY